VALAIILDTTTDYLLRGWDDSAVGQRRPYFPLVDLARGLEAGDEPVTVHIGDSIYRIERTA